MKRIRQTTSFLALFAMILVGEAVAQLTTSTTSIDDEIDHWSNQTGIIVTKEVRDQIAQDIAFKFATDAPKLGLKTTDAWHIGGVIADGGRVRVEGNRNNNSFAVYGSNKEGDTVASGTIESANQNDAESTHRYVFWSSIRDYFGLDSVLSVYPQVRLVVQPVPPRDYSVTINGRRYAASEAGLYGVQPGVAVMVRVERAGKQPCDWSGIVMGPQGQTITCSL